MNSKKSKLTLAAIALMLAFASLTACSVAPNPPSNQNIDAEAITRQVRNALANEIAFAEMTDTLSNDLENDSTGEKAAVARKPIIIKELRVVVDSDNYSAELMRYNERLNQGHKFALSIIFIIAPLTLILLLVGGVMFYLLRRNRERNQIIEEAIRNNYHLPDSFYENTSDWTSRRRPDSAEQGTTPPPVNRDAKSFKRGVTYTLVGIGIIIMLGIWGGGEAAVIGIIPMMVGIANLITYYKN